MSVTGALIFVGLFGVGGWLLAIVLWLDLRERDRKAARARNERAIAQAFDPGPLDDSQLRTVLSGRPVTDGHRYAFLASRTLDRVQDAFERLIREKRTKGSRWLS